MLTIFSGSIWRSVRFFGYPVFTTALFACLLSSCLTDVTFGDDAVDPQQAEQGAIYFKSRYFMGGQLADIDDSPGIAWQHSSFDQPFIFDKEHVTEISFRQRADAGDRGELGIELSNGDLLFGLPTNVSDGKVTLETELLGSVTFDASLIRRIFRWSGGQSLIFSGPGSLTDWQIGGDGVGWRSEGGHIFTSKEQGLIYRDVGLTQRCRIEVEVSWEQKPNFVIALGTDGTPESTRQAFRIEFWGSAIVMLREMGRAAKVSSLGTAEKVDGRLKLAIELDQFRQRATVYSDRGARLGEIDFASEDGSVFPGIAFENIQGSFRLHNVNILQGAGGDADAGTLIGAKLVGFEDNQLRFENGHNETTSIPLSELTGIRLKQSEQETSSEQTPSEQTPSGTENQAEQEQDLDSKFHLVTHGSTQLSGVLERIADQKLFIKSDYLDTPVGIPFSELRSLRTSRKAEQLTPRPGRQGTLEMPDVRMLGVLQDAVGDAQKSCLKFQPVYASNAAQLLNSSDGKIVYRDRELTPEQRNVRRTAQPVRRAQGGFLGAVVGALAGNENQDNSFKRHLHLRSGDAVEARVLSISEEGVLIDSVVTGKKMLPHQAIKAVELKGTDKPPELEPAKKSRLLTVPRLRKKTPPTHLLVSTDGDFLKGNLISLDEEQAIIENRLDTTTIPRRMIATVIWFHEDEIVTADDKVSGDEKDSDVKRGTPPNTEAKIKADTKQTDIKEGLWVQAIHSNGVRLTFHSGQFGDDELVGNSPVLGACLVNVRTVDQLLFGSYIEASNEELPYSQWRLAHAPEPKVLSEGGDGMQSAGTSSPLVGNPAPDFQLDLISGERFRISDEKGKVLVLDFWATWCGPCLNAMPLIDEAVHEFDPTDVKLIAVNLQESPEQIQATLKRLNLDPIVALDIDGVAAARYQANAIPQTVVIDREGVVRRVFVGGGNGLKASLSDAIKSALEKGGNSGVESE